MNWSLDDQNTQREKEVQESPFLLNLESKTPANFLKQTDSAQNLASERLKNKKSKTMVVQAKKDERHEEINFLLNNEKSPLNQLDKKTLGQEKTLRNV